MENISSSGVRHTGCVGLQYNLYYEVQQKKASMKPANVHKTTTYIDSTTPQNSLAVPTGAPNDFCFLREGEGEVK